MSESSPPTKRKVALFGGTFDPIHQGHVFIATEAQRHLSLDEVIFIPCWQSPHKSGNQGAPVEHRVEMVRLATEDLPWAVVSGYESSRGSISYSWQTAAHFHRLCGSQTQLYWLLGGDQWDVIDSWSRPDYLAKHLVFLVFPREGQQLRPHPRFQSIFLTGRFDAAATAVRKSLGAGHSTADIIESLPPKVLTYIQHHGLYSSGKF